MAAPAVRRLAPHDPLPEFGPYVLVLRRFAEDDPQTALTEITVDDGRGLVPVEGAAAADFEAALRQAVALAQKAGIEVVYAVDRTAGTRERAVLAHGGDHSAGTDALADTDPEDGEDGTDIRDRPRDAGSNLTPKR